MHVVPPLELVRSHYQELRKLLPNHHLNVESMKTAYNRMLEIEEAHRNDYEAELAHDHFYDVAHWLLVDHTLHALQNHSGLELDEHHLKKVARFLGRDYSNPTSLQVEDQLKALDELEKDPLGPKILDKVKDEYEHLTVAAGVFAGTAISKEQRDRKDMFGVPMNMGLLAHETQIQKATLEYRRKLAKERESAERN